jgi:hypothetical protein
MNKIINSYIDMETVLKKFNIFISKKKTIYTQESTKYDKHYTGSGTDNVKPNDTSKNFINIIINLLSDKNFKFTLVHFDKFINQVVFGTFKSFLTLDFISDKKYRSDRRTQILNKLFKLYTPTSDQFNKMIKCNSLIGTNSRHTVIQNFDWLECLSKNYKFTTDDIINMNEYGIPFKTMVKYIELKEFPLKTICKINFESLKTSSYILNYIITNKIKIKEDDFESVIALTCTAGRSTVLDNSLKIKSDYNLISIDLISLLDYILNNIKRTNKKMYTGLFNIYCIQWGGPREQIKNLIYGVIKKMDDIDHVMVNNVNCAKTMIFHKSIINKYIEKNGKFENCDEFIAYWIKITRHVSGFVKIMNTGFKLTVSHLMIACVSNNRTMISEILKKGVQPTMQCLEKLCLNGNVEIVKEIIKSGLKPTDKCLELAYVSKDELMIELLMNNKLLPSDNCIIACILSYNRFTDINKFSNIIDSILENGGSLTKFAVRTMIQMKIQCDYKKYNILYDDDFYELCHFYNFYPYDYLKILQEDKLKKYRLMFLTEPASVINTYWDLNKIPTDIYCLENACLNIKLSVVNTMNINKLDPSMLCLYRIIILHEKDCIFLKYIMCKNKNINKEFEHMGYIENKKLEYGIK